MHLTIPSTEEQLDGKGGAFTTYVILVNGVRHCHVRYRQLHFLHEQLKKDFPSFTLPTFPPKKLFPLSPSQVEERRVALEKYLQIISLDPRVSNGVTLNGFLLAAQQEVVEDKMEEVNLDVYLMNDHKVSIRGLSILQTEEVIEKMCKELSVPDEFVHHFALFLVQRKENGDFVVLRKLQDFESPYISHRNSNSPNNIKLVLRKASWHPELDIPLFDHTSTLNLLYIQTIVEVERGWIVATPDTKKNLALMQARGAKKEYMEVASLLPYYGFIHFLPCICDYPMTNTPAQIIIGNRELLMKIRTARGEIKEGSFKVTKMRCWRIMTIPKVEPDDLKDAGSRQEDPLDRTKLELSFEYLMNNKELQWITIVSSQAILMSLCLQSMVEELLRMRNGIPIKKAGENSCSVEYSFLRKNGSVHKLPIRTGSHAKCSGDKINSSGAQIDSKTLTSMTSRHYSVKKLTSRFDVVNFRDALQAAEDVFIENEAFVDICEQTEDGRGNNL